MMTDVVHPFGVGVLFGLLLHWSGMTRHEPIVGVFRLTDLAVLKFLGTAIATGALATQAALSLKLAATVPVTPTLLAADAIGGAVFGVAMAICGFCPGSIVAGVGAGRLDSLIAGGLGLLFGALLFGLLSPRLAPIVGVGSLGAITLPALVGVEPWICVALLIELALLGFYALERRPAPRAPSSCENDAGATPAALSPPPPRRFARS
jgi:hypothetical protein